MTANTIRSCAIAVLALGFAAPALAGDAPPKDIAARTELFDIHTLTVDRCANLPRRRVETAAFEATAMRLTFAVRLLNDRPARGES